MALDLDLDDFDIDDSYVKDLSKQQASQQPAAAAQNGNGAAAIFQQQQMAAAAARQRQLQTQQQTPQMMTGLQPKREPAPTQHAPMQISPQPSQQQQQQHLRQTPAAADPPEWRLLKSLFALSEKTQLQYLYKQNVYTMASLRNPTTALQTRIMFNNRTSKKKTKAPEQATTKKADAASSSAGSHSSSNIVKSASYSAASATSSTSKAATATIAESTSAGSAPAGSAAPALSEKQLSQTDRKGAEAKLAALKRKQAEQEAEAMQKAAAQAAREAKERKEREEREMKMELEAGRQRYQDRLRRYERDSGIHHSEVMAEQSFVSQASIQAALDRQCEEHGLQKTDRQADHKIFECLTLAVQTRLTNMVDEIVKIAHHRNDTQRLKNNQDISVGGKPYKVKVLNPKPKVLLAVLRRRKEEKDGQDMVQKAAKARQDAETEEAAPMEAESHDEMRARALQEQSNAAAEQFSGGIRKRLVAGGGAGRLMKRQRSSDGLTGTRAYIKKLTSSRGASGDSKAEGTQSGGGGDGGGSSSSFAAPGMMGTDRGIAVAVADVLVYLENASLQNRKLADLRHRTYLALRYHYPNEDALKLLLDLRPQAERAAKRKFKRFECLGVRTVGDTYFYVVTVDDARRLNVTIRQNEVIEAFFQS